MYTIHPTELEQFMKCPWAFHHSQDPNAVQSDSNPDKLELASKLAIFQEGDITEQLMTAYQYGPKLGDKVLQYFMESKEFPHLSRLKAHAQNRKDYLKQFPQDHPVNTRFPLFTQKRMHLLNNIQLMSDQSTSITFDLTGTADRVYSDGTIADCKTASRKRSPTDPTYKLQRRLYPLMWYKNAGPQHSLRHQHPSPTPQPSITPGSFQFTYYVFTKQVTPQLQVIPLTGTYEDSERLLNSLLTELARCIVDNDWPAKKNLACKRCDYRTECPLYAQASEAVREDERF